MIYLDNSATTPLAPEVAECMNDFRGGSFANASSVHRLGQRARVELEIAREGIAVALGAEPKEIIFTSGGTEANNYALKGYALHLFALQRRWPVIVTARTEHHAVLHPADFLESLGATVIRLDVNSQGSVEPGTLRTALAEAGAGSPLLVSIMHANNETGTINPVAELAAITHQAGGHFHTDAVQSFGKLPIDVRDMGMDLLSISAHKIHGPKGVGALYVSKELELESLMHGGAQERNRRGGTEPVELIAGFRQGVELAIDGMQEQRMQMAALSRHLRGLLAEIEGVRFVAPEGESLANIVTVTFDDAGRLDGEGLIVGMDLAGVAVSNGSACTSGSMQPSHVLTAMGYRADQARAAVRFSLSRYTTQEEIERGAEALREVVLRMRGNRIGESMTIES
jgi:cysteine desulfurase